MNRKTILLVAMLIGPIFWGFGQSADQNGYTKRCLTDELSASLRASYPDGFPGRTPASAYKGQHEGDDFEWTYVIPVVVHVMHDNGPELLVDSAEVYSQLEVLNEDFGRYGAGYNEDPNGTDTRIRFCLASVDPDGNPSTGINYVQYPKTANINPYDEDTLMKRVIQWDPERYLNIWVVRQIDDNRIQGYAYFPSEVAGTIWDGYVVDYKSFGRYTGSAFQGRTGTHEVGHYLSLLHPWGLQENLCNGNDDKCDDTPKVGREHFATYPNCMRPDACDGSDRMIENYMDYSDDRCMNIFTRCQAARMRSALVAYRSKLVSSSNLVLTGCSQVLDTVEAHDALWVYPNPAKDVIMVYADFDDQEFADVEVYDHQGRLVTRIANAGMGMGPVPVDMTGHPMGMYQLVVKLKSRYYRHMFFLGR